ncbi:DNA-directed RNA polymerase III RPC4, putative [Cellulomonas gilvus ATCC 13127]|uniref:DNA-directed RNA polymerase III RPC4, putative n=1 Tax=Cellulomonas gilvus (strain ATCC 13127 / NRRL B-14078) TaxID=593907 RepID=F8A0J6_CELGA|nr:DNA-directed RNA polymerase III RPC4, putative [Cellulomonas gilvus ATCC 13127]
MQEMWGPALEAELTYRRQELVESMRAAGVARGRRAPGRGPGGSAGPRTGTRAARGWSLPGSGAWSAAR